MKDSETQEWIIEHPLHSYTTQYHVNSGKAYLRQT